MQENLIRLLRSRGLEINEMRFGLKNTEICRILDSDKLIFLIQLSDIENLNVDFWVNRLMDWVTYENPLIEKDLEVTYKTCSMRMILWDLYVIFAVLLSNDKDGLPEERVYEIQRDSRLMKRYIVQGISENQIADEISFIVMTEKYMDEYIEKLEFNDNEEKHCESMCSMEKYDTLDLQNIKTYQDIVKKLEEINGETFGEKEDENKRDKD